MTQTIWAETRLLRPCNIKKDISIGRIHCRRSDLFGCK